MIIIINAILLSYVDWGLRCFIPMKVKNKKNFYTSSKGSSLSCGYTSMGMAHSKDRPFCFSKKVN